MEKAKTPLLGNMFADDPVFKGTHRDSRGRFATEERAMYDKTKRENIFLRYQVEKYKRLAEQASPTINALYRITQQQGQTIAELRKELAQNQSNMLDKELGKEYPEEQREKFLQDNCDDIQEVSYSKSFSPEELAKQREDLTDAAIKLADIEDERKEANAHYKEMMKPLQQKKAVAIENLKKKAMTVTEDCFKFFDEESKMIGFYNKQGDLVSSRPAFPDELQKTIFATIRKDGTNNK